MVRYTLQQRIEIVKIHYKNGENFAVTVRKTKALLGRREAPSRPAIVKLVENFELLGQVSDVKNRNCVRRSRTTENIAVVARSVDENPGLSIPRRSLELGIFYGRNWKILMWTTFIFNKTALSATQATKQSQFCKKSFLTVLFLEEVITIGHRDLVI